MQFLLRVVVVAFVTEVQDQVQFSPEFGQPLSQAPVVVQVGELVALEFGQGALDSVHGVEVVFVEDPTGFEGVYPTGIAHHHHHLVPLSLGPSVHRRPGLLGHSGDDEPLSHHAQVLPALGLGQQFAVEGDVVEVGLLHQFPEAQRVVQALGVELVGDHTGGDVADNLAGDEPVALRRE